MRFTNIYLDAVSSKLIEQLLVNIFRRQGLTSVPSARCFAAQAQSLEQVNRSEIRLIG